MMFKITLYLTAYFIFVLPSLQQNEIETLSNAFKSTDPNCLQFLGTSCVACFNRYFLNTQGKCLAVNPSCQQYSPNSGQCTRCYPHFTLEFGSCKKINAGCKILNIQTKKCYECLKGYILNVLTGECQITDPYCLQFNSDNSCQKCKNRYYQNKKENKCEAVSLYCKQYNVQNGACTSCIRGLKLKLGVCLNFIDQNCLLFAPKRNEDPKQVLQKDEDIDQNLDTCIKCKKGFEIIEGLCVEINEKYKNYCIDRFYYNSTSETCIRVSDLCVLFHQTNGFCIICISEYVFFQSRGCMRFNKQNLFANIVDQNKNTVSQSNRYGCSGTDFLMSGTCRSIDMNCINFNYQTLSCLNCRNVKKPSSFNCID